MKRYIHTIAALAAALLSGACAEMMTDADEAKVIRYIDVAYKVSISDFTDPDGNTVSAPAEWFDDMEITFNNFAELIETTVSVGPDGIASARLTPGIYNVTVRKTEKLNGKSYILNALNQNVALIDDVSADKIDASTTISVRPILGSPLCFREIYYCGAPGYYFRGQFYEIYNNGDDVVYLDHLCMAQLHPANATTNLPAWPAEDGVDRYAYGVTLWQIQGDGDDWPLLPGESIVISQEAADHTKNTSYSGAFGLIDNSKSEWECWAGNPQRVNEDVPDLPYVFWSGYINQMQWLTSVSGSAFCLYQPGRNLKFGDNDYWKVGVTTQVVVGGSGQEFARMPVGDILDAVELIPTMSDMNMKRIPGIIDSGAASVGGQYLGKSICRKIVDLREDGTPIYQDTNNSTDDFEVMDFPVIRRNGERRPSWSPWAE